MKNKQTKPSGKTDAKGKQTLSVMEEEQIFSPWRTAIKNFTSKKLSMLGVIVFVTIFLCCVILPFIFPLDVTHTDVTQQNIRPTQSFMNVPTKLKNNIKDIGGGSSFGAGIDSSGELYQWGAFPTEKLKNIPSGMGKLSFVSAGLDHVIAVAEDGKVYTWGNDRLGLKNVPANLANGSKNIVQIEAGHQISTALDDLGNLHVWGNENIISITTRGVQGRISKYAVNTTTVVALLDDRTVAALTNKDVPFGRIPERVQGRAVDIASTDRAAGAVLDDGTVVVWGSMDYGEDKIPESVQGRAKEIHAGRNHFTVLLNDGSVISWGRNDYGQTNTPKLSNIDRLYVSYHQNYAIDKNGNVTTWGMKGYLMGTDQFGRDVFLRLIYAGRITMTIGALSVIIMAFIGILVGGISGYYGGMIDIVLMRIGEIVDSIPFYPIAILLSAIIGNKIPETGRIAMIMCIIGFLSWPGMARLTRAQILSERESEYVTAAKAMGVKEFIIIFRHILPNILPIILVRLTMGLATSMLTESSLSFVGFGVREPSPTWGNMLNSCVDSNVIANYWWRWVFPSIALGLSTLSINTVGDGLRDAIDPKSNDR